MALGALLIIWGLPLQAAQLTGLYEAEVEVADQGRAARATAMGEAMAAVLLKVSGNSAVLDEEVIKSAMADASRYVQQYRYRNEELPPEARKAGGAGSDDSRLLLWVGFDSASIDSLLRRFGFNAWSAARPSTLVWLAVEEGSRRVLVGANDQGLVREVLDSEAQRRGLPVRLPLLDLTDQSKVRAIDVWGGFVDNIEAASSRYEAQAILTGKLYAVGKSWEARWTLHYQGEQHQWQHSGRDVREVVASGVGGTADYLAQQVAAGSFFGMDQLVLRIEDVSTMEAYRRVNDYLLSLPGVTAVTLRRTAANSSSFIVDFEGGRESVLQAITLGDLLVKVAMPAPQSSFNPGYPAQPALPPGAATPQVAGSVTEQPMEGDGLTDETAAGVQQPQVIPLEELVYRLLP